MARRLRLLGNPLSGATGGRLGAILFLLCGALVVVTSALPLPDGADGRGLVLVGLAAMGFGLLLWHLPWDRWSPRASLYGVVPPAMTLIALHNIVTDSDGYRFGLFFLVLFAWVGLSHPPGTSVRLAPILAVAYAIPMTTSSIDVAAVASLAYAVPIAVLTGETAASVAARLRRSDAALRASEERWRSMVMNASDLILVIGPEGTVEYATPAAERLFGYPDEAAIGTKVLDLVHPDDLDFVLERLARSIEQPGIGQRIELRVRRADGTYTWVEQVGTNLLDDPNVRGIVCNVRDISERKEAERVLFHRSRTDSLTGLPNRHHLLEVAERSSLPCALLLLDLDGFKEINDALGHETGDRVLVEVAHRLGNAARGVDLVARLGGDEFAVLAPGVEDLLDAMGVGLALRSAFDAPIDVDGMRLHVSASIGIALPDRVATADDVMVLLQRADVAMYRAKGTALDIAVFGPEDHLDRPARLMMAAELRAALEAGEVIAHFQPQLDLATGHVRHVEALARWTRDGVAVPPDEFIPLAERTGLIRALTEDMLRQSLAQCRRWADVGLDLGMSVNVSAPMIHDRSFRSMVTDALSTSGVPADRLTLEITEGALADQTDVAISAMQELRALGVRLSVDDFGSGYSSMAYLKRLPIDELKIDKEFVLELLTDERDQPITRAIIELGHSLGLTIVAEGVESPALEEILRRFGCDSAQGFGICRPRAADALTAWLGEHAPPRASMPRRRPGTTPTLRIVGT